MQQAAAGELKNDLDKGQQEKSKCEKLTYSLSLLGQVRQPLP